jgi:hypothetical protein
MMNDKEILRVDDMTMDQRGWMRIIVSPPPHHTPYFENNIDYIKTSINAQLDST